MLGSVSSVCPTNQKPAAFMSVDFVIAVSSSSVLSVILDELKALALDLQQHVVLLIAHKSHHKQLREASPMKEVMSLQFGS